MSRILRLLVVALIIFVIARLIYRALSGDEDFDDFDDIEAGLEFTETPVEIDVPADTTGADATYSAAVAADAETTTTTGEPSLIDIEGIGPTYASRLMDAGISTLDDLAKADPDSLAEQLDIRGGRATVENWIQQAQGMTSSQSQS